MADISLGTSGLVSLVTHEDDGTVSRGHIPLLADCSAGAALHIDPTTGKLTPSNATTALLGRVYGLALRAQKAGYGITVIRLGILDGWDLSALNYGDPVYLSDTAGGVLSTTAGTVTVVIGKVVPATATRLGTAYDKVLEILPVY